VEEHRLDDGQMRSLFRAITRDNSRLPDVKRINDSFKDCLKEGKIDLNDAGHAYHNTDADKGLSSGANMTVEQIIGRCQRVRSSDEPSTNDVDFMHAWDGFYYAYTHLKELGWEPKRYVPYLTKIRDSVLTGKFLYSSLPPLEHERDVAVDIKRVMDRENKTVTFEQLKIFKK
jgi:hypothetical protein